MFVENNSALLIQLEKCSSCNLHLSHGLCFLCIQQKKCTIILIYHFCSALILLGHFCFLLLQFLTIRIYFTAYSLQLLSFSSLSLSGSLSPYLSLSLCLSLSHLPFNFLLISILLNLYFTSIRLRSTLSFSSLIQFSLYIILFSST